MSPADSVVEDDTTPPPTITRSKFKLPPSVIYYLTCGSSTLGIALIVDSQTIPTCYILVGECTALLEQLYNP